MPTTRPRHTLTETDDLDDALRLAAQVWPEDDGHRGRLLQHIIADWVATRRQTVDAHRRAIRGNGGRFPGLAHTTDREALRAEWPE